MNDQSLQRLWQSLFQDGLADSLTAFLDSTGLPGMLDGMASSTARSTGTSGISRLLPTIPRLASSGPSGIGGILQSMPIAGGLLRELLGSEGVEPSVVGSRFEMPDAIRLNSSLVTVPGESGAFRRATGVDQGGSAQSPTVVININAMDSMSILDRSDDIASAVRQAMLTYQPFDDIWR